MAKVWNSQPQYNASIDTSNPLAQKLLAYIPNRVDVVNSKSVTLAGNGKYVGTDKGLSIRGDGATATGSVPVNLSSTNKISISFWMYWDTFANNDKCAMEHTANINTVAGGFALNPNSSTTNFEVATSQGSPGYKSITFPRPSAVSWHYYVITIDRSASNPTVNWMVMVDGVKQTLNSVLNQTTAGNFVSSTLYLLSRGNASLFGAGNIQDLLIFNGLLTEAEGKALTANPYQLIQDPQQEYFAGFSAPIASSPTASASITTASSTVAAVSSVSPVTSASISTAASTVSASASISPLASAALNTGSSTVSASSSVSPLSSAAISTAASTVSAVVSVSCIASALVTTSASTVSANPKVSPLASSVITTAVSIVSALAGSSTSAAASITTAATTVSANPKVSAIASSAITTAISTVSASVIGSGSGASVAITTAINIVSASVSVSPLVSSGITTAVNIVSATATSGGGVASSAVTTQASFNAAVASVSPITLMAEYTDFCVAIGSAICGSIATGNVFASKSNMSGTASSYVVPIELITKVTLNKGPAAVQVTLSNKT